jgi:nucleoside-diphosphate-sugar epimerase
LITGGAVFLGSHLCERLLESHLSRQLFFTGARRNTEHPLDHKHFDVGSPIVQLNKNTFLLRDFASGGRSGKLDPCIYHARSVNVLITGARIEL